MTLSTHPLCTAHDGRRAAADLGPDYWCSCDVLWEAEEAEFGPDPERFIR